MQTAIKSCATRNVMLFSLNPVKLCNQSGHLYPRVPCTLNMYQYYYRFNFQTEGLTWHLYVKFKC